MAQNIMAAITKKSQCQTVISRITKARAASSSKIKKNKFCLPFSFKNEILNIILKTTIFACPHFLLASSFNLTGNAFVVNFCYGCTNIMVSAYQGFNVNRQKMRDNHHISLGFD